MQYVRAVQYRSTPHQTQPCNNKLKASKYRAAGGAGQTPDSVAGPGCPPPHRRGAMDWPWHQQRRGRWGTPGARRPPWCGTVGNRSQTPRACLRTAGATPPLPPTKCSSCGTATSAACTVRGTRARLRDRPALARYPPPPPPPRHWLAGKGARGQRGKDRDPPPGRAAPRGTDHAGNAVEP